MSEDFYERAKQLGQAYWELRERIKSTESVDINQVNKTVAQLEESLKSFEKGSLLRSRIEKQVSELKQKGSAEEKLEDEMHGIKQQLLELTATSFEVDPEGERNLSEHYIKAIAELFFGEPRERFEFHECIVGPDKVETVEDKARALIIMAHISHFMREAAKKKLGRESILDELWHRLTKDCPKMFKVYSVLASQDRVMTIGDVTKLAQDVGLNKIKVKNNLNNLLLDHLFDHKLIRRVERGKFQVSDVGRVLYAHFGPTVKTEVAKISSDSQMSLNTWGFNSSRNRR